MGWVKVVGVGPGSPEYLTKIGERVISEADYVAGAEELLKTFAPGKKHLSFGEFGVVLKQIKDLSRSFNIALLLRGDTGFYSLLRKIEKEQPGLVTEVIPGISSVQLAFARLKKLWDGAAFYSLHGRALPEKLKDEFTVHVFLLGEKIDTSSLKQLLQKHGLEGASYYLLYDLSYPEEKIVKLSFADLPPELSGRGILIAER